MTDVMQGADERVSKPLLASRSSRCRKDTSEDRLAGRTLTATSAPARIAGVIHLAHPTRTEWGLNLIGTKFCAGWQAPSLANYSLKRRLLSRSQTSLLATFCTRFQPTEAPLRHLKSDPIRGQDATLFDLRFLSEDMRCNKLSWKLALWSDCDAVFAQQRAGFPPAQNFGPYEIQSPLGSGGMGEVYHARDTRLERDVAVKVLPAVCLRCVLTAATGARSKSGFETLSSAPCMTSVIRMAWIFWSWNWSTMKR